MGETTPSTPYWIVTTSSSCGDGCYTSQQFYDPATRQFLDPKTSRRAPALLADADLGNLFVAPDGSAYVTCAGDQCEVIRFKEGRAHQWNGKAAGWLGGGWYVSF